LSCRTTVYIGPISRCIPAAHPLTGDAGWTEPACLLTLQSTPESTVHALSISVRLIVTVHSPSDACVCSDEVRASSCGGGAASLGELQHPNVTPENTRRPYVWSDVSSCVNYNTGLCPDSVSRRSPCVCVLRIYIYHQVSYPGSCGRHPALV